MGSDDQAGDAKAPEPEVQPAADPTPADQDEGEMVGEGSFPASDPPAVWTRETPGLSSKR